jgi:hypothetical protein
MIGLGFGLNRRRRRAAASGGPSVPAGFTAGQILLLDSPSPGGNKLILRPVVTPANGGSGLIQLRFEVDSGAGFGAEQSVPWTGLVDSVVDVLAGAPATFRVWLRNGVGDGPKFTITPAVTPTVAAIVNQTAFFPALTPSGAGGFKPFDASGQPVALTGSVTHQSGPAPTRTWTINGNGDLVANGTPGVDHGTVLRCTLAAGGTVDIAIDATTYDGEAVAITAEYDALIKSSARFSNRTHLARCRDINITALNATGQWANTGPATLQAERSDVRRPLFIGKQGFVSSGGAAQINLRRLNFFSAQANTPYSWNFSSPIPTNLIINAATRDNILLDECEIYSDYLNAGDGFWPTEMVCGVESRVPNFELRNCIVRNVMIGARTAAANAAIRSINTQIYNLHGDFYNLGGGPVLIQGGAAYNLCGVNNTIHQDLVQTNGSVTGGILFEGRTYSLYAEGWTTAPGPRFLRRPAEDPIPGKILTFAVAANLTLDPAVHGNGLIQVTANNVTITLPLLASVPEDKEFVILVNSGVTGTSVVSSGGETATHTTFPRSIGAGLFDSFKRRGATWTPKGAGTRMQNIFRFADATGDATDTSRTHIFDTSLSAKSYVLPPSPADLDEIHVQVARNGEFPVTVTPNTGHTIRFNGGTVASHSVPSISRPATFVFSLANQRWNARGTHQGNQGGFSNVNAFPFPVVFRGCIISSQEAWAWRLETAAWPGPFPNLPPDTIIHHSTFLPYGAETDFNGDGILDESDGTDTTGILSTVECRATATQRFVLDRSVVNFATDGFLPSGSSVNLHRLNNFITGMTLADSFAGDFSKIRAVVDFTHTWPETPAQARQSASVIAATPWGSHGPDEWWNFATNTRIAQPNMTATVQTVYDGGQIVVKFSDVIWLANRTGTVTLFNVTDGVTVETFDVASSPLVVVGGNTVTITPTTPLTVNGKTYSVRFDGTCFPSYYTNVPLAVTDNALSFVTQAIVYPSVVSASNSQTVATTNQFQSATFTLDGAKRYVIHVALRCTTTSDPVAVFTRGTAGRAYGTGTVVVPQVIENHFAVNSYAILIDPTTSPGAETIQVTTSINCNFAAFEVIEIVNATAFGASIPAGITSAAPSANITNQAVYSTILGLPVVNAGIVSAGAGVTAQYVRTAQTIHSYGALTKQTAGAGVQSFALVNSASAQTALILLELRST